MAARQRFFQITFNPAGHAICALLLLGTIGCAEGTSPSPGATAAVDETAPPSIAANADVSTASWQQVQERVASASEPVVLVNIWTTTCPICLAHMPDLMELCRTRQGKVHCIQVNCDYDGVPGKPPEHYRPKVVTALEERGALDVVNVDNVMMDISFLDFLDEIELNSTPAILVYDRERKLIKRFDNDDSTSDETDYTLTDVAAFVDASTGSPRDETSTSP